MRLKEIIRGLLVIPIYRDLLSDDELCSLVTIRKYFSSQLIIFVAPESLNLKKIPLSDEHVIRFDNTFFDGIAGYNKLLTSSLFYEQFSEYSHILICQLDCLVFRDELDFWCAKGYDYIAAPWFQKFLENPSEGLWRVGNGGFSLRNVQSHLRVLKKEIIQNSIYPKHGNTPWVPTDAIDELGLYEKNVAWYHRMNPFATMTTVEEELQRYPRNEDLFWSLEAPKFDSSFKVASVVEALPFAFEMAPRWCFEKNGNRLPFGCHAWNRYDRQFWEEILKNPRAKKL